MKWINAKEKWPEKGSTVAVIYQHWKEHKPLSYEVMFGEVCYSNKGDECHAVTGDYTGKGSWGVYFKEHDYATYDEQPLGWMLASDFIFPDWEDAI